MKNIVVLGAGLASVPLIRQIMRDVVLKSKDYKMIVVAPNTHFHFPIAMPRIIVPGQMSEDKAMVPLNKHFDQYPADKFEFVLGEASNLATESKEVTVALSAGGDRAVNYDTLIVATGASSRDPMPWKILGSTDKTKAKLNEVREEITQAKTIVVAGGGSTGVETAGELGFEYAKDGKKEVYLVHAESQPLPGLIDSVRKQARAELERMKVQVIANSTVTGTSRDGANVTVEIKSANGETRTIQAQSYISATGVTPNSGFAPKSMLDSKGYFKQTKTLQVEGSSDIFVIGDVGNLEVSKAMSAGAQGRHLIQSLPAHLLNGQAIPEYKPDTKDIHVVTLGRAKATGQFSGWKLPSFILSFAKGRTLFTEKVEAYAAGKGYVDVAFEK